ncbi:MAG: NAD(P)/FAD-dependent oxidoreductase [Eubacteriales bacterium]
MKKVVVVGAGPAGVSSAIYTARANIDTLIIANGYGSLETATVENYYGFDEPISGKELIERGIRQVKRIGASVINAEVLDISFVNNDEKGNPLYNIKTTNGEYLANAVNIAVGQPRKKLSIKNSNELEGQGVSYCATCDGFFYKGKDVCIIGSGKYALNEAQALMPIAKTVTLLTNGADLTADFPSNINIVETKIESLNKNETTGTFSSVTFVDGMTVDFSGAFIAEGMASSIDLAKKLGVITEKNKIVVSNRKETNIPGIYASGDCTGGILQIAKAVNDGAIAGISITQYLQE